MSYNGVTYPDPKELAPCRDYDCLVFLYFFYKGRAKEAYRMRDETWANYKQAWAKNDQPLMDTAYTHYLELDTAARALATFVVKIDDRYEQIKGTRRAPRNPA